MRILFVAPRYHTNQHPLVRALLAHDHAVRFDVVNIGKTENHDLLTPFELPESRVSRLLQNRFNPSANLDARATWAFQGLARYSASLRSWRPDVMIVRDPNRVSSVVAILAARLHGIKLVLYVQAPTRVVTSRRVHVLRSIIAFLAGGPWISPVRGDPELPPAHPRLHYVPFVIDPTLPGKQTWSTDGTVRILSIGKFTPRKNHLLLLRAFHRAGLSNRATLTIVGEVSTPEHRNHIEEVRRLVHELELKDRVEVRTNVPHGEMSTLYLSHDLFVLPSRNEPAAVSVLEAMVHGLPVICSSTNGTRHYIEPGRSGFVFASDDEADLSTTMIGALCDPQRLRDMGETARRSALSEHDPDLVVSRLLDVIHDG